VTVARAEFGIREKPATISRIAILTGLTRKEVQAFLDIPIQREDRYVAEYNRAARVITGWLRDPAFGDGNGHPVPLPMAGKRRSFGALVKRYSGDIPVRAMLDELMRVGTVKRVRDGRLALAVRGYIPQKGMDQRLSILGQDVCDLVSTIDHNLYGDPSRPRIQRKVMYDNVPLEAALAFQAVAQARAQEMLEALDRWLSHRDRDVNPTVKGKGRMRVGLGVYHSKNVSIRTDNVSAFHQPIAAPITAHGHFIGSLLLGFSIVRAQPRGGWWNWRDRFGFCF
jgi:hypothetical protein